MIIVLGKCAKFCDAMLLQRLLSEDDKRKRKNSLSPEG